MILLKKLFLLCIIILLYEIIIAYLNFNLIKEKISFKSEIYIDYL